MPYTTDKPIHPFVLWMTFFAITFFYFFEAAQMSYFNVLAPYFLHHHIYHNSEIANLSAAYYYGDMLGLLPAGAALDRFNLRRILLLAILGSIGGAFLLAFGSNFYMAWLARFMCGFFGGTFSFVGGIRLIAKLFPHRFTLCLGLFLAAGMFAGLMSQYPLLLAVKHIGAQGAMLSMAVFGVLVGLFNLLFFHPPQKTQEKSTNPLPQGSMLSALKEIVRNSRNWLDCLMIVLLDIPVSVIGTLWGIVLVVSTYHFSEATSASMMMSLFAGLMLGSPAWGALADRYQTPSWMIVVGGVMSFFLILLMLVAKGSSPLWTGILFFGLGFFSSCQTLGFTWLTQNMRPEWIGINSAFNSIIFMGTNGLFKQVSAYVLVMPPLFAGLVSADNLLLLTAGAILIATLYAVFRRQKVTVHVSY